MNMVARQVSANAWAVFESAPANRSGKRQYGATIDRNGSFHVGNSRGRRSVRIVTRIVALLRRIARLEGKSNRG